MSEETNLLTDKTPQARTGMKDYSILYELDEMEKETLEAFLKAPKVDIYYDLNDQTDYAVPYMKDGKTLVARISDTVTINGVRWHLFPGKNKIPAPVYEFLKQCPEQRRRLSCPRPGEEQNLGLFK